MTAQLLDAPPRTPTERTRNIVSTVVTLATFGVWWLADSFGPVVHTSGLIHHLVGGYYYHTLFGLAVLVAWCIFIVICAPRVSYRRRDALFMLAGPVWWGWLTGLIVYRLMLLPYRDWDPRADETGWTQIHDPDRPGRPLFLDRNGSDKPSPVA